MCLLGPYNTSDYPITIVVIPHIYIVVGFHTDLSSASWKDLSPYDWHHNTTFYNSLFMISLCTSTNDSIQIVPHHFKCSIISFSLTCMQIIFYHANSYFQSRFVGQLHTNSIVQQLNA